jgi:hypothetical protein
LAANWTALIWRAALELMGYKIFRRTSILKPTADAVDVQFTKDSLVVILGDGRSISAPLAWFPRLLEATSNQRRNWRLIGGGIGIHWEDVDEDISVRTLLAG